MNREYNRIIYVRNLPLKMNNVELYDLFGKFGPVTQIRIGNAANTRGSAYVVYEDQRDARAAVEQLAGFNVAGRYLVCGFFRQSKIQERMEEKRETKGE
jgi:pre-mRNA branch site protein p14